MLLCSGIQFTRINVLKLLYFSNNLTAATIHVTRFFLERSVAQLLEPLIGERGPWIYLLLCEWHVWISTPLCVSAKVESNNFHYLAHKL